MQHLCLKLGWDLPLDPRQKGRLGQPVQAQAVLGKRPSPSTDLTDELEKVVSPTRVGDRYVLLVIVLFMILNRFVSHVWLFEGADGGRWLREFERTLQQEREVLDSLSRETLDEGHPEPRNSKKARVM